MQAMRLHTGLPANGDDPHAKVVEHGDDEGGAGLLGATPKHGLVPGGGPGGVVTTMVFIMVVVGWQLLAAALVVGVPRWADRRSRRRMIAELGACRVGSGVGEVLGRGRQGWGPT
jgi:hypothetical protein